MFEITLIAMGKLKEKFYISAAEEYKKRLLYLGEEVTVITIF